MDTKAFFTAINEVANAKGISQEAVYWALKEALIKAYTKHLGGGDDAVVSCNIDEEKGSIYLAQIKKVVEEVEDDYLEVDVKEANKGLKKAKYKIGDDFPIECPVDELSKLTAIAVKNNLRQKIAEAERVVLYDIYKDHIGEMVTGTVEKYEDRSVVINIGRTSVELSRKEMIGDEVFKAGDPIKVYIQEVKAAEEEGKPSKGPQIEVTRSSEGFLKRLFEEEIHEVYDGTVVIKAISREAGIRSKVAVYSSNDDIDPTGACIGPGGSRIQKVVGQLGNGKDKEKIDIIAWSANPGLYIAESLRPAQVLGVVINDANAYPHPKATAVVKDEQLSVAIGRKGANARLANKLTGYSIDIVEESVATAEGLSFTPTEELMTAAKAEKKDAEKAAYAQKSMAQAIKRQAEEDAYKASIAEAAALEEAKTLEQKAEAQKAVIDAAAKAEAEKKAILATTPEELASMYRAQEAPVAPVSEEAAPVVEEAAPAPAPKVEAPKETIVVHTTTSLEALEKELEKAKERTVVSNDKRKRPRKITEEEVERVKPSEAAVASATAMPIYSPEELEAMAQDEADLGDSDINDDELGDLSDYDKYYDDDGK